MEDAAKNLRKLIKGNTRDEYMIIKEIYNHNKTERQEIKKVYFSLYNTKLEDDIKSNLSGSFLSLVLALFEPTDEYEAHCLKAALKEMVHNMHNVRTIVQILCTKSNEHLKVLGEAYKKLFGHSMLIDIEKEESGDLGKLLQAIAIAVRDENAHIPDTQSAITDANTLINAEKAAVGIDDEKFVEIFTLRSFLQLTAIFDAYKNITNVDIEKAVKVKFDGSLELAYLGIIKTARNQANYFAEQIHDAIKRYRNCDEDLIRLLVIRSEIDLPAIKIEYKKHYNQSLQDAIDELITGDKERYLLLLLGHDQQANDKK